MSRNKNRSYKSYNDLGEEKKQIYIDEDEHLHITDASQFDNMLRASYNNVCILYVHAKWCGPCKTIGPVFGEMAKSHNPLGIQCLKMDGEHPVCAEVGVRPLITAFPTFLVLRDGEVVETIVGGDMKRINDCITQYRRKQ